MPLPQWLARFNRVATNRVGRRVAGWAPGFAVVRHVGRRSGRVYETPVAVFRRGDVVTIALTYGGQSEWVKNVLAAGGCELRTRGKTLRVTEPRVVVGEEGRRGVPWVVRVVLGGDGGGGVFGGACGRKNGGLMGFDGVRSEMEEWLSQRGGHVRGEARDALNEPFDVELGRIWL